MLLELNDDMLRYISEYLYDVRTLRHVSSATLNIRYDRRLMRKIYSKIPCELYFYSVFTLIPLYVMFGDNPIILINPAICIYFMFHCRSYRIEYLYV